MDRFVILVDVGYLLAEGGKAYCSAPRRSQVRCDYGSVSTALEGRCRTLHGGMTLLRSYWYDGAPNYVPTQDHLDIGALPRVKLRLGRLVPRRGGLEQKGVDSLIVHDMITLANERAIASIYLLAGDEDLREGVAAAQRLGIQVTLLGIPTQNVNQSSPLISEADEHVLLDEPLLSSFFQLSGIQPGQDAPLADAVADDAEATARRVGAEFAKTWTQAAGASQVGEILAQQPAIPKPLDVQLILDAEVALGVDLRGRQDLRHALRTGFWEALQAEAREATRPDS